MNMPDAPPAPPGGLLGALVEALPVGIMLQRADRRVELVNTAFVRLLGISARPDELLGVRLDAASPHVRDLLGGGAAAWGQPSGNGHPADRHAGQPGTAWPAAAPPMTAAPATATRITGSPATTQPMTALWTTAPPRRCSVPS